MICEKLDILYEDHAPYIASHEVICDDETAEPRICGKRMLARNRNNMTQDDATYRLTWQGEL